MHKIKLSIILTLMATMPSLSQASYDRSYGSTPYQEHIYPPETLLQKLKKAPKYSTFSNNTYKQCVRNGMSWCTSKLFDLQIFASQIIKSRIDVLNKYLEILKNSDDPADKEKYITLSAQLSVIREAYLKSLGTLRSETDAPDYRNVLGEDSTDPGDALGDGNNRMVFTWKLMESSGSVAYTVSSTNGDFNYAIKPKAETHKVIKSRGLIPDWILALKHSKTSEQANNVTALITRIVMELDSGKIYAISFNPSDKSVSFSVNQKVTDKFLVSENLYPMLFTDEYQNGISLKVSDILNETEWTNLIDLVRVAIAAGKSAAAISPSKNSSRIKCLVHNLFSGTSQAFKLSEICVNADAINDNTSAVYLTTIVPGSKSQQELKILLENEKRDLYTPWYFTENKDGKYHLYIDNQSYYPKNGLTGNLLVLDTKESNSERIASPSVFTSRFRASRKGNTNLNSGSLVSGEYSGLSDKIKIIFADVVTEYSSLLDQGIYELLAIDNNDGTWTLSVSLKSDGSVVKTEKITNTEYKTFFIQHGALPIWNSQVKGSADDVAMSSKWDFLISEYNKKRIWGYFDYGEDNDTLANSLLIVDVRRNTDGINHYVGRTDILIADWLNNREIFKDSFSSVQTYIASDYGHPQLDQIKTKIVNLIGQRWFFLQNIESGSGTDKKDYLETIFVDEGYIPGSKSLSLIPRPATESELIEFNEKMDNINDSIQLRSKLEAGNLAATYRDQLIARIKSGFEDTSKTYELVFDANSGTSYSIYDVMEVSVSSGDRVKTSNNSLTIGTEKARLYLNNYKTKFFGVPTSLEEMTLKYKDLNNMVKGLIGEVVGGTAFNPIGMVKYSTKQSDDGKHTIYKRNSYQSGNYAGLDSEDDYSFQFKNDISEGVDNFIQARADLFSQIEPLVLSGNYQEAENKMKDLTDIKDASDSNANYYNVNLNNDKDHIIISHIDANEVEQEDAKFQIRVYGQCGATVKSELYMKGIQSILPKELSDTSVVFNTVKQYIADKHYMCVANQPSSSSYGTNYYFLRLVGVPNNDCENKTSSCRGGISVTDVSDITYPAYIKSSVYEKYHEMVVTNVQSKINNIENIDNDKAKSVFKNELDLTYFVSAQQDMYNSQKVNVLLYNLGSSDRVSGPQIILDLLPKYDDGKFTHYEMKDAYKAVISKVMSDVFALSGTLGSDPLEALMLEASRSFEAQAKFSNWMNSNPVIFHMVDNADATKTHFTLTTESGNVVYTSGEVDAKIVSDYATPYVENIIENTGSLKDSVTAQYAIKKLILAFTNDSDSKTDYNPIGVVEVIKEESVHTEATEHTSQITWVRYLLKTMEGNSGTMKKMIEMLITEGQPETSEQRVNYKFANESMENIKLVLGTKDSVSAITIFNKMDPYHDEYANPYSRE